MERRHLGWYLTELERRLRRNMNRLDLDRFLRETEDHIMLRAGDFVHSGSSDDEAIAKSIAAFGTAKSVSDSMIESARPRPFGIKNWTAFMLLSFITCILVAPAAFWFPLLGGPRWFAVTMLALSASIVACFFSRRFPLVALSAIMSASFVVHQAVSGFTMVDLGDGKGISRIALTQTEPDSSRVPSGRTHYVANRMEQQKVLARYASDCVKAFAAARVESELPDAYKPWTTAGRSQIGSVYTNHLHLRSGEYLCLRNDLSQPPRGWKPANYPFAPVTQEILDGHASNVLRKAPNFESAKGHWLSTGAQIAGGLQAGLAETDKAMAKPFHLITRNFGRGVDEFVSMATFLGICHAFAWFLGLVVPIRRMRRSTG